MASLGRMGLFASGPGDPRARRPLDGLRIALALLILVAAAVFAEIGRDLDQGFSDVLVAFPGVLRVLWRAGFWVGLAWGIVLLACAAASGRLRLVAEGVAAVAAALVISVVVAQIVSGEAETVVRRLVDADGPPVFPPASIAVTSAVLTMVAPYLTLPARRFGRVLIGAQAVGSLFLGVTLAMGAVGSLAIGMLAGSLVNLAAGSPGGFPTVERVQAALAQLGLRVDHLTTVARRRDGVALLAGFESDGDRSDGTLSDGPLHVKVYGRDAWDAELIASLWRRAWYRDSRRTARLRRAEYVEHEGFMTFLAARTGARVPEVVTAGRADNGDALIVVRPNGAFVDGGPRLDRDQAGALWDELAALHSGGIAHGRIDLDRVVVDDAGRAQFGDLSSASVQCDAEDRLADRAQLLALTMVTSGEDAAVAAARDALGAAGLVDVVPYLQEPALPPLVRAELRRADVELDDARDRLAAELDAPQPELAKLRRVTWGSLLNLVLVVVAAYTIIGMLGGIDYDSFGDALAGASWWWLVLALVVGQLPRAAQAFSTIGSSVQPLPVGPTTALQFAGCYLNIAVPSSAGQVAITTRFFQRFGVPPATALAAGFIDTATQMAVQIVLFVVVFFASDVDLGLSLGTDQLQGVATIAMIAVAVIVGLAATVALVPRLRRWALSPLRQARDALQVLRMPSRVVQLLGGNLAAQVLFAVALACSVRAFGFEVPLSTLLLVNAVVSLFSSVLPVPGGVGVMEAGLALGLTRAGVPDEPAFAIALSHRFATFYLPPIWGWFSYRWLIRNRLL